METAVALVQAYLQVNGYFTVVEDPVLEAMRERVRTVTDLDILAFRFPGAGCETPGAGRSAHGVVAYAPDPALEVPPDQADMIVGEVKQGPARFNPPARNPLVLAAALTRFGCCPRDQAPVTVRRLLDQGHADSPDGHAIRLVAFGSGVEPGPRPYTVIRTAHMIEFLRTHLRRHWPDLTHVQINQPALAFLCLLAKAGSPGETGRSGVSA